MGWRTEIVAVGRWWRIKLSDVAWKWSEEGGDSAGVVEGGADVGEEAGVSEGLVALSTEDTCVHTGSEAAAYSVSVVFHLVFFVFVWIGIPKM